MSVRGRFGCKWVKIYLIDFEIILETMPKIVFNALFKI